MKCSTKFLLLPIIFLVSCSQSNNEKELRLEKENKELKEQISKLEQKDYVEEDLKNADIKKKHEDEKATIKNDCKLAVSYAIEYSYNKDELGNDLLKYFGFNDISKDKNAYNKLSELGLWWDSSVNANYWSILPTVIKSIDRSPENIIKIFNEDKSIIFNVLDSYVYSHSKASMFIESLLSIHKNIIKHPDYEAWINTFLKDNAKNTQRDKLIPIIEKKFGNLDAQLQILQYVEPNQNLSMEYWLYSFWFRRYTEKNIEVVHSILDEINSHYKTKLNR